MPASRIRACSCQAGARFNVYFWRQRHWRQLFPHRGAQQPGLPCTQHPQRQSDRQAERETETKAHAMHLCVCVCACVCVFALCSMSVCLCACVSASVSVSTSVFVQVVGGYALASPVRSYDTDKSGAMTAKGNAYLSFPGGASPLRKQRFFGDSGTPIFHVSICVSVFFAWVC